MNSDHLCKICSFNPGKNTCTLSELWYRFCRIGTANVILYLISLIHNNMSNKPSLSFMCSNLVLIDIKGPSLRLSNISPTWNETSTSIFGISFMKKNLYHFLCVLLDCCLPAHNKFNKKINSSKVFIFENIIQLFKNLNLEDRMDGVMVSVVVSSPVDRGFDYWFI